MKTNKQKMHGIVDAVLGIGFWLSFFLNLTGVALHQWLGIAVGALAVYHLLAHWDWVKSVSQRFLGRASGRARLFYLIDASLLLGLGLIVVSGVVISTWLALPLAHYAAWKDLHVMASIVTLLITGLKLVLHWRWIAALARQHSFAPSPVAAAPARLASTPTRSRVQPHPETSVAAAGQPGPARLGRREFLKLMGVVGAASLLAVGNTLKDDIVFPSGKTAGGTADGATGEASNGLAGETTGGSANEAASKTVSEPANEASSSGSESSLPDASSPASQASTACTVRCNRRCSYPGRCHRYTDSNQNNRCDWGECIG